MNYENLLRSDCIEKRGVLALGHQGLTIKGICDSAQSLVMLIITSVVAASRPLLGLMQGSGDREGEQNLMRRAGAVGVLLVGLAVIVIEVFPHSIFFIYGVQWTGERAERLRKIYPKSWDTIESQLEFLLSEFDKTIPNADPDAVRFYELARENDGKSAVYYSDLFQALIERNVNRDHYMEEVTVNTSKGPVLVRGRLSKEPNKYDGRYYLDADRRRNYAAIYRDCISAMSQLIFCV